MLFRLATILLDEGFYNRKEYMNGVPSNYEPMFSALLAGLVISIVQ